MEEYYAHVLPWKTHVNSRTTGVLNEMGNVATFANAKDCDHHPLTLKVHVSKYKIQMHTIGYYLNV